MNRSRRNARTKPCDCGWVVLVAGCGLLTSSSAWARQESPPPSTAPMAERVAATVEGTDIYVAQVDQYVERLLGGRSVDQAARQRLQAEALEQLIRQQIVLRVLEQRGDACTPRELDLAITRFKDELGRQELTLAAYCRARGIPVSAFSRAMRWQLSWAAYLQKSLTEENLRQYFDSHRADFDGTKMRVAQILLTRPDHQADRAHVEQRATAIREEILSGKLSFAAAARQYSQSPSARDGGALAWIARHEPMPEDFSRAAFQLQVGEISLPLVSAVGVHLIQCLEIEPGTKSLESVRDELTTAMKQHLFEWNVTRCKTPPEVRYTGAVPYLRPGTQDLVVPEQDVDHTSERTGK